MTREIRELEAIVADMRIACERWQCENRTRDQEIPGRRVGEMKFNSKGEAYYD